MANNGFEWKLIKYNEEDDVSDVKKTCILVIIIVVLYVLLLMFCQYKSGKALENATSSIFSWSNDEVMPEDIMHNDYDTIWYPDGGTSTLNNLGR